MISMAVSWELYQRTHQALTLGLIGLVQVVPVIMLFLASGTAADRYNRKLLACAAVTLTGLCGVGFAVASAMAAPVPIFLALLFLMGVAASFHAPASAAVITTVIPREHLPRYNPIGSSAFEVAAISGPTVAGLLLAVVSPSTVYALTAMTAATSVACYLALPATPAPNSEQQNLNSGADAFAKNVSARRDWRVGLRFIFASPLLLPALTLDMFAVLFAGVTALLPVVAHDWLHTGSIGLGVLRAAPSVGAISMALLSSKLPAWRRPGVVLLIVVALYGLDTVAFGFARSVWLAVVLMFIGGALDNISVVIRITLEQMVVPDAIRGRVSAVHHVFIGMSNELGELESGFATHMIGLGPTIVGGGIAAMLVVAFIAKQWPSLHRMPPLADLQPEKINN
jgi:MFS family permease